MSLRVTNSSYEEWLALKQEVKEIAATLGIDEIGFASADPFFELRDILVEHRALGYESGFEEPDLDRRISPNRLFTEPQSILAIAVTYPAKLPDPPRSAPGAFRGVISRSSWGKDYHHVLQERLNRLASYLANRVADVRIQSMVDTGALVDRAVAERAGIGWIGKNCSVISPTRGSWIFLGEMITNIPFPPDTPVTDQCGECTLCLDACPTGALVGPGQLDAQKCISFLTQTKHVIEDKWKTKIGNRLYGCDTCQIVCPKNKGLNWTHQAEFEPDPELVKPLLLPLLEMSNKQFKETYGHTAAAWRGKTPIQRNAILALGHFKETQAIPKLIELLHHDQRVVIRATAAWALAQMDSAQAIEAIQMAWQRETHESVKNELVKAITKRKASVHAPEFNETP